MPSLPPRNPDEPSGLLRTLFVAFSGVLFGVFLSKLKAPPQQSPNRISPKQEAPKENNSGSVLAELTTQITPSPPTTVQTCKCCHHKIPRWKIVLDWLMFAVTTGAFAAAGVYAWIAKSQLDANERPRVSLGKEGTKEQIIVDGPAGSDAGPKTINFPLRYALKNFGHSPAQVSVLAYVINQANGPSARDLASLAEQKCRDDRPEVSSPNYEWAATIVQEMSFGHDANQLRITEDMRKEEFIADSGRCRSAFRADADHSFRAMSISDSGGCRSLIPG